MEKAKLISACLTVISIMLTWSDNYVMAGTIYALDCQKNSVQNAISQSLIGDDVVIPVGNCSWSGGYISINKKINVIGSGSGSSGTIINTIGEAGFQINTGVNNSNISSIRWIKSSEGTPIKIGNIEWSATGNYGWRINNNYFIGYSVPISVTGRQRGLIDNNIFFGFIDYGDGIYVGGENTSAWKKTTGLGTSDFVFIENNVFNTNNTRPNQVIALRQGGRMVVRYNTFLESNNGSFGGAIDVHGNGHGNDVRSGRAWEIYNNVFRHLPGHWVRAMHIRGGTGLIYNNIFDNTTPYAQWDVYIEFQYYRASSKCSGGAISLPIPGYCSPSEISGFKEGWPCTDQHGRGMDISTKPSGAISQSDEPIYIWGNLFGTQVKNNPLITPCDYNTTIIVGGRDYLSGTQKVGYIPYVYPHPLANNVNNNILLIPMYPPINSIK